MTRLIGKGLAALAIFALANVPAARAGMFPVGWSSTQITTGPDAGHYKWTYDVILTSNAYIQPGDYFTIYDFSGFVPGSAAQPAGWSFNSSLVGDTPGNTVPTDDPAMPNLTWTWTGTGIEASSTAGDKIFGQQPLGQFGAISLYGSSDMDSFTARSHKTVDDRVTNNITDATVPVPDINPPDPTDTPEPATLALMGIGLPLAGMLRFLRKRRHD